MEALLTCTTRNFGSPLSAIVGAGVSLWTRGNGRWDEASANGGLLHLNRRRLAKRSADLVEAAALLSLQI